jgi:hypothetical protein
MAPRSEGGTGTGQQLHRAGATTRMSERKNYLAVWGCAREIRIPWAHDTHHIAATEKLSIKRTSTECAPDDQQNQAFLTLGGRCAKLCP